MLVVVAGTGWWCVPAGITVLALGAMATRLGHRPQIWLLARVALIATGALVATGATMVR